MNTKHHIIRILRQLLGLCLNIRILRVFGAPPSEIPRVWSIPEYTNTAGIWFSPLGYKVFGLCLNIRILRVFGSPRKYNFFGYEPDYTNTSGIWCSLRKYQLFGYVPEYTQTVGFWEYTNTAGVWCPPREILIVWVCA